MTRVRPIDDDDDLIPPEKWKTPRLSTEANGDKGPGGRFTKGNKAAVGRRAQGFRLRELIEQGCTEEDWLGIVRTAVRLAKIGDRDARKWLSENQYGKPRQTLEVHQYDGDAMAPDRRYL